MYRVLVKKLARWVILRLRRGETRWLLALMSHDVHFRFLGDHSWAADYHSKAQVRSWLQRYVRVGLELEPHEVVVSGPPWNTHICTRFTDRAKAADGSVIYENEGVLFDALVWGRIREHISYEDTQRTAAFDQRLAASAGHGVEGPYDPQRQVTWTSSAAGAVPSAGAKNEDS